MAVLDDIAKVLGVTIRELIKEEKYGKNISYINELSFYVFCLKGFTTNPLSRYSKKRNRIELEILLPFDKFETANDSQCVEILKQSILDAIENYKNKNIPQQYIDVIVEKMKASINE